MRAISKGSEPQSFIDWKNLSGNDWQPSYKSLRNPEKQDLHQALLLEQGHTCCYCGKRIGLTDSHIEHFIPQHHRGDLDLEYKNLLASCIREVHPSSPLHCGHAKAENYSAENFIDPTCDPCESRFIYVQQTGQILPSEVSDSPATYMIETLRLNTNSLKLARASVLKIVFDMDFLSKATIEDLEKIADGFRQRDSSGILEEYGHVVSRYADYLIKQNF